MCIILNIPVSRSILLDGDVHVHTCISLNLSFYYCALSNGIAHIHVYISEYFSLPLYIMKSHCILTVHISNSLVYRCILSDVTE